MLKKHEPPVYEIHNAQGNAPLLIGCDHAENRIPENLLDLGLEPRHLGCHIACDIGAREVSKLLSDKFDAPLIMAGYSRLVVDLNRYLDDPSVIAEASDDIPIPGNMSLEESERQERIDTFFYPYHEKFAELALEMKRRHDNPLLLAVHSFTPFFNGHHRPWHYGVLWDEYPGNVGEQLLDELRNVDGLVVGDNEPYTAHEPQGYAHVEHGQNNGMQVALIEIRQDLISHPEGQREAAEILYRAFGGIMASHARTENGRAAS